MESTSSDIVLDNEDALQSISDHSLDNNFCGNEISNSTIDATLKYLSKILLEEEIYEKDIVHNEGPDLWAMEKPFYDILGQEHPLLLNKLSLSDQPQAYPTCTDSPLQYQIDSSFRSIAVAEFNQGDDEGNILLSNTEKMAINFEANKNLFPSEQRENGDWVMANLDHEDNENEIAVINGSSGKRKTSIEDLDLVEGCNYKIPVPYIEEPTTDTAFDEVLLYPDFYTKDVIKLREIMQTSTQSEKQNHQKLPDFEDLLVRCSRLVAANDRQNAEELIKEIRKQSSPDGNANQRVADVLADALENRLTGTGSESYKRFVRKQFSTTDNLKVHHLYMTAAPFTGISINFVNQTILKAVNKASKLHIIDFGINFGFHWPSLIQVLSNEKGGAIKLRITGIEFAQPGFRPAKLVEETGHRLKEYARMCNVPFEYHGIASQWETIALRDLRIEKDEVLIVHSMYRFRQLGDETTGLDCPRDQVLKLIRRIRPRIFIYGVFNWRLSPFFITRFKQAMSLYETMFDLLDSLVPRDNKVRQIIERDMLARDATNLIACEGSTWIERPETYKQWHQRTLRAGFEQLPLDPTIVKKCKETLRKFYDKRFFEEEDGDWFLMGWRGRILYGLSTWKPK
ncbi:hypothetical protein LUZ63_014181 [Rhynchospora breviuscula]|uniref:GRAS family transcription factor n=1 Tax=Rhynchospora breviuscula TaxID=2022672 RepID=A0A9Q0HKW8_9POAL|nr:hypothetical protein LUZ63_014181 [Rhynchospora breviuscula]